MEILIGTAIGLIIIIAWIIYILTKQLKIESKYKRKHKAGDVVALTHVYGLPLSEWLPVACYIAKDKYVFIGDGKEFIMSRSKIKNKYITTDIDIQKQAVSNVKGAIAGSQAFGAIGALLADNAKIVNVTTIKKLLIFEYESDSGDVKTFAFDIANKLSESDAIYKFAIKKQKEVIL